MTNKERYQSVLENAAKHNYELATEKQIWLFKKLIKEAAKKNGILVKDLKKCEGSIKVNFDDLNIENQNNEFEYGFWMNSKGLPANGLYKKITSKFIDASIKGNLEIKKVF